MAPAEKCVDNISSAFTPEGIAQLLEELPDLGQYHPTLPAMEERANAPPARKVALFHQSMVKGNLRVPPTPFFMDVLEWYRVGLPQLHPYAVGKVIAFEMFFRARQEEPALNVFRNVFRLATSEGGWYTFDKRVGFVVVPKASIPRWKEFYLFVEATIVPVERAQVLIWYSERPKNVSKPPPMDADETRMYNMCQSANITLRTYSNVPLVLGGVSSYWPWKNRRPAIFLHQRGIMIIAPNRALVNALFISISIVNACLFVNAEMDLAEFMGLEDVSEVRCARVSIEVGNTGGAAGGGASGSDAGGSMQTPVIAQEGDLNSALLVHATPVSMVAPQEKASASRTSSSKRRRMSTGAAVYSDASTFVPIDAQRKGAQRLADEPSDEVPEDDEPLRRVRAQVETSGVAPDTPILLDDEVQQSPPHVAPSTEDPAVRVDHLDALLSVSSLTAATQHAFLQRVIPFDLRRQIGELDSVTAHRVQTQMTLLNLAVASDGLNRAATSEGLLRAASARADEEATKNEALSRKLAEVEEELRAAREATATAEAARQKSEEDEQALRASLEHAHDDIVEAQQTISAHLISLDQAVREREEAEREFTRLQEGLPRLAANILKSSAVRQPFGEVLTAVREAERLKTLNLIASHVSLPEPLPEAITAQINQGANERLARASAAMAAIEIPALVSISSDTYASAAFILDAEL